jgi:glucose-1-phosphate thymidylyltransferase
MDIIGLIPAGGIASRLGKLPCSKEVLPFINESGRIMVISENLIRYFSLAGISDIYFIIRKGKWDIPEYFGDGRDFGVNLGYLIMNLPFGAPYTLDQAYPFIRNKMVALGFPDILFEPHNAYQQMKDRFLRTDADIMLGLVPTEHFLKSDMIVFDGQGRIVDIVIKQNRPDLKYSWFAALWRPSFTSFMHNYLIGLLQGSHPGKIEQEDGSWREVFVGDVIRASVPQGLKLEQLIFETGRYTDVGTMDEYSKRGIRL